MNLELALARDVELSRDARTARDLSVAEAMRVALPTRGVASSEAVLRSWMTATGASGPDQPGSKLDRALLGARASAVLIGTALGVSGTAALLRYDGTRPVNVAHFLAVMVLLQIALLFLFAVSALLPGGPHRALRRWLSAKSRTARAAGRALGRAEGWTGVALAQTFGVAFNTAVIATALATVTFTDLAFAWSTTLALSVADVHRLTTILAAPWSSFWPEMIPTRELVETTQYYRLAEVGFVRDATPASYGAWWPFLVAAVLAYGLVPRCILLFVANTVGNASRRSMVRDSLETQRMIDRIRAAIGGELRAPDDAKREVATRPPRPAAAQAAVILWRDLPFAEAVIVQLVKTATGSAAIFVRGAGGKALDLDGEAAARAVSAAAGLASEAPVVIVVDLFSAMDKALGRFLTGLRQKLGAARPILILPLASKGEVPTRAAAVDMGKLAIWRRSVRERGDPALDLAE